MVSSVCCVWVKQGSASTYEASASDLSSPTKAPGLWSAREISLWLPEIFTALASFEVVYLLDDDTNFRLPPTFTYVSSTPRK
jgi:hypothetical protein